MTQLHKNYFGLRRTADKEEALESPCWDRIRCHYHHHQWFILYSFFRAFTIMAAEYYISFKWRKTSHSLYWLLYFLFSFPYWPKWRTSSEQGHRCWCAQGDRVIRQRSKQRGDAVHTNDILAQALWYSQLLLGSETRVKASDVSLMLSMCLTRSVWDRKALRQRI